MRARTAAHHLRVAHRIGNGELERSLLSRGHDARRALSWLKLHAGPIALPLLALILLVAGSLLGPRLRAHHKDARPRNSLRFVATNPWMLEQFCTSLGTVLREWPELREVSIDVQALAGFDHITVAALKGALATARGHRVELRVSGHTRSMARSAVACGFEARCFETPRSVTSPSGSLH